MLDGFGDAQAGEWVENRPAAFHLRRRLTTEEQQRVGPVVDVRGTDEGKKRLAQIEPFIPPDLMESVKLEWYPTQGEVR